MKDRRFPTRDRNAHQSDGLSEPDRGLSDPGRAPQSGNNYYAHSEAHSEAHGEAHSDAHGEGWDLSSDDEESGLSDLLPGALSDALSDALMSVESILPETPPNKQYFERLVEDTKRQAARKLRKDVSAFAGVAVLIGAGWFISATANALIDVLAVTSGLSLMALPIGYGLYRKSAVHRSEEGQGS